jgi:hypothetical protein
MPEYESSKYMQPKDRLAVWLLFIMWAMLTGGLVLTYGIGHGYTRLSLIAGLFIVSAWMFVILDARLEVRQKRRRKQCSLGEKSCFMSSDRDPWDHRVV